jgi:hypothetical protein
MNGTARAINSPEPTAAAVIIAGSLIICHLLDHFNALCSNT